MDDDKIQDALMEFTPADPLLPGTSSTSVDASETTQDCFAAAGQAQKQPNQAESGPSQDGNAQSDSQSSRLVRAKMPNRGRVPTDCAEPAAIHDQAQTDQLHHQDTITRKRNVIIVGKTGVGKSTLANHIFSEYAPFKVSSEVESVTRSAAHSHVTVTITINSTKYQIKIKLLDVVGPFSSMLGKPIVDNFKTYLRNEVPEGINLVIFVVRSGPLTNEEKEAFDYIIKHFKHDINSVSALVITGCEGMSVDARKQLVTKFKQNFHTREFATLMQKGIHTVGFPNISSVEPQLKPAFELSMKEDEEEVRSLVINARQMVILREKFQLQLQQLSCTLY